MCIEIVYTSDQNNVEIEIVYTSGQKMLKSKKFTLLPKYDFRTIKGKHIFAIYFPNADFLMIKGKHLFVIFQVLVSILGFYVLGFIFSHNIHVEGLLFSRP